MVPAVQAGEILCDALPRPALADSLQSGLSPNGLSARRICQIIVCHAEIHAAVLPVPRRLATIYRK
mgnify:FL=1